MAKELWKVEHPMWSPQEPLQAICPMFVSQVELLLPGQNVA